ncbi:hypothetical protein KGA66_24985 [Actinocrinis puniceicyclus]|uniref:Sulfocyanin-like C-terminal domain-containing protein n=1 Tax=Actinocrinis puniceicyclus TaxID=977794 RepID=A0A8J8BF65_9ACTN|nr:sulfocyanin-like copper-binding protein [Actinocrinis puniceicyclus]MBS2966325.1 hypothetical protein [Actinocrinis puniceicyclus]
MKRTAKLAAILTIGATATAGVVLATGPVSAAAGGGGNAMTRNGAGTYSTSTNPGTAGYGGMMGGWTGGGNGMMNGWTGGAGAAGMMGANGVGMMGSSSAGTDMGAVMGRMPANVSGPRESAAQAAADAAAIPPGASVDAARNRLTFTGDTVALTVVAGADEKNMYSFEAAGLTNPEIVVPAGAHVTLHLVNADTDMAHGVLVTATSAAGTSWMPMMTSAAAFPGAAIWALGEADGSGAPTATTSFTATTSGSYTYLCPIPGHPQQGMHATFTVR